MPIKQIQSIVGLKELRENIEQYIALVEKGKQFTIVRRSKPVFTIIPVAREENWETVIDFTKLRHGGVSITDLLSRV